MRNRPLFAIALGMLLLPVPGAAQQAAAWRDSAQRLDVAVRALRDSMLQGDSTAAEVARRGDLAIAASPKQKTNAIDALDRFVRVRDRWYGSEMPSASGFRIVLRTESGPRSNGSLDSAGAVILAGLPDTEGAMRTQRIVSASTVASALIDRFGEMMIASVPTLSAWMETPPPLSMDESERRDQAMYAFVTAMGPIERRCVAGDVTACSVAMRIRQVEGAEDGDRYSPFMRADLLYFALDLGGPGAWARLRSAADSGVGAMLSAAARMPTDSVLARWRSGLLALRPATAVITARSALIAITWSAILLIGALGASKWA